MALARKHDMNFWRLVAPMAHGWAIAATEGTEAGWDEVRRAVADCREQGITCFATSYDVQLAAMKARAGYFDAALTMLDGALAEAEQTKARVFVADGHRIRGEILLKRDPTHTAPAEEAFLAAIAIVPSLARHWRDQGKTVVAAPIYGWFTEGFDTREHCIRADPDWPLVVAALLLLPP